MKTLRIALTLSVILTGGPATFVLRRLSGVLL